jgi:hypothetical protein
VLLFSLVVAAPAQATSVEELSFPAANAALEGDAAATVPFVGAADCADGFRFQQVFDPPPALNRRVGWFRFRFDASTMGSSGTYGDVTVTVSSTDRTPATLSTEFDANLGLDRQVFALGDVEVGGGGLDPTAAVELLVDSSFEFGDEGDQLLLEIQASSCPENGLVLDAVTGSESVGAVFAAGREATAGQAVPALVTRLSTVSELGPISEAFCSGSGEYEALDGLIFDGLSFFPRLGTVDLEYRTTVPGEYVVELEARQETFDGAIIGSDTEVFRTTTADLETSLRWNFYSAPVSPETPIAFIHRVISGPEGGELEIGLGDDDVFSDCDRIVRTGGVEPPVDSVVGLGAAISVQSAPDTRRRFLGGNWTVKGRSAEGFMIDVTDRNQLVAIWFTYDVDGTPLWLIGSVQEMGDNAVGMEMFRADGPSFAEIRQVDFDNDLVDIQPWGRMYLRFETCDRGTVSFDSTQFGGGSFEIERLYRTESATCF